MEWVKKQDDFTPGRLDRSPIAEHLGRSDQPWLDGIAWRQAGDHCVITFDDHNKVIIVTMDITVIITVIIYGYVEYLGYV